MKNLKAQSINLTSSTLSAVALIGALAFVPAQAKADEQLNNILGALGVMVVLNEVYKNKAPSVNQVQTVYGTQHNPLNERRRPGYASGMNNFNKVCGTDVVRRNGYSEVVETNCYGQVLNVKIVRR